MISVTVSAGRVKVDADINFRALDLNFSGGFDNKQRSP
jgi:hypothetical protein